MFIYYFLMLPLIKSYLSVNTRDYRVFLLCVCVLRSQHRSLSC